MNYEQHLLSKKDFLSKTIRKQIKASRKCHYEGCNRKAVFNHVFSQAILKNITDSGNKLYFLDADIGPCKTSDLLVTFKEIGWDAIRKQRASMNALCNDHDSSIFRPIENNKNGLDWENAENHKLLAYRSALHEFIKYDNVLRTHEIIRLSEHNDLYYLNGWEKVDVRTKTILAQIKNTISFLQPPNNYPINFDFRTIRINKKIEFYMCAYLTLPVKYKGSKMSYMAKYESHKDLFFTFLPFKDHSILSIGGFGGLGDSLQSADIHLENINVDQRFSSDEDRYLKYFSDVALRHSDTWCFSSKFYSELIQPREKEILSRKDYFLRTSNSSARLDEPSDDFCLFW